VVLNLFDTLVIQSHYQNE